MLKVGVIGLGYMGKVHMMNCTHINDVKVVAAADLSKRALKRAESWGIENLYQDYHKLLEESAGSMDAVIISLPNHLHFESVQLALESGLDVFIEKPMSNTVKECTALLKLEKKSGRKIMVGHYMRFIPFIEKMKELKDKAQIGSLEVITAEMINNGPFTHPSIPKPIAEWWFIPEKIGGGVVLDLGTHLIDLYRFLGGEPEVKYASLFHKFNLPIEDGAIIILNSPESSIRGIINIGWYQKSVFPKLNFRIILHGTAGFLSSDELRSNVYSHAIKEGTKNILRRLTGKGIWPLSYSEIFGAYYKELSHFFNCIKDDTEPSISSFDGLKTVEIIEEIYNQNKKVKQDA